MYTILIVDDEKIERNGIKFLLKKQAEPFEIYEAPNGKAALEQLCSMRNQGKKIDILLTDVKMPFMDGIELIGAAKEEGFTLKTIIFSGYNEFEYAKLAVRLGVSDYILKPVNPQEFAQTIEKVTGELQKQYVENEQRLQQSSYMREYLLYTLFNGGGAEQVHTLAGNLAGENFWNHFHRIVFLEFDREFFGKKALDFQAEILEENMSEEYQYLNLNPQQAVLLLNASPHYMTLQQTAQKLHDAVFKKYGEHCHFAISGEIDDYEKIPQTMDMLEALMENKFYRPDVYVYSEDISGETPVLVQIDDDTLMKQMKQDIKMKDVTFLRIHFEALCKKYRGQSNFSHIYIKFVFSNLLKDFYDNIPGANQDEFSREIDRLYTSEDFSCIMDIVNKNIDLLEKSFGSDPVSSHREIEMVKDYIHGHFGEEISAQQLADMVYLAPSYLSSLFKKETGQNLSKYIKQYRMEKARQMLEETNMKIVCISEKVGYPNVSYFCQSFREYCGVSPQKFRENAE